MGDGNDLRELAAFFKPVEGGYIFRAPSGWRLWRRPHFLVNPKLRERLIAATDEPMWVAVLWFTVPWLAVSFAGVVALAVYLGDGAGHQFEAFAGGLVFAIAGLVVGLAVLAEHKWQRVAPLLRDAEPSNERISSREIAAAVRTAGGPSRKASFAQVLSGSLLLAVGGFSIGMVVAYLSVGRSTPWPQLFSGVVMMVSGAILVYFAGQNLWRQSDDRG